MKPPPKRLFRQQRATRQVTRDIWDVEPGDDRRFAAMMRLIGPAAQREIDRLPEEAATLLLLLFFCRYRGWGRVKAGGKVIHLVGDLDELEGYGLLMPDRFPEPLRRAWEAIQP